MNHMTVSQGNFFLRTQRTINGVSRALGRGIEVKIYFGGLLRLTYSVDLAGREEAAKFLRFEI